MSKEACQGSPTLLPPGAPQLNSPGCPVSHHSFSLCLLAVQMNCLETNGQARSDSGFLPLWMMCFSGFPSVTQDMAKGGRRPGEGPARLWRRAYLSVGCPSQCLISHSLTSSQPNSQLPPRTPGFLHTYPYFSSFPGGHTKLYVYHQITAPQNNDHLLVYIAPSTIKCIQMVLNRCSTNTYLSEYLFSFDFIYFIFLQGRRYRI